MGIEWIKMAELGLSNIPALAALISGTDKKKKEQLIKDIIQEVELLRVENRRIKRRVMVLGYIAGANAAVTVAVILWIFFGIWNR